MPDTADGSVYVVHVQTLALADRPFPPVDHLRPVWQPLFGNPTCFSHLRSLVWHAGRRFYSDQRDRASKSLSLPTKPFLRNLGPLFFNTRSARLTGSFWRQELAESLGGAEARYADDGVQIFGYDPEHEDQRMNHLYLELATPVALRANGENGAEAEGKIFIHLYPSGYVTLLVALSLAWTGEKSLSDIRQLIQETRPWRRDSRWVWSSRIAQGTLAEVVDHARKHVQQSLLQEDSASLRSGQWRSMMRLASAAESNQIATELLMANEGYQVLDMQGKSAYVSYLVASRQGLVCVTRPASKRKTVLNFFWKIGLLAEFVALKHQIYEDYAEFLRREVGQLKDFRLSLVRKATREDLLKFSVYDHRIPQYLSSLDGHIRNAAPFHRRIYSAISTGTGFDERREQLLKLVEAWEKEVAQWEPNLVTLWKRIISPLRSLLSMGK